jgi:hypothetical protein
MAKTGRGAAPHIQRQTSVLMRGVRFAVECRYEVQCSVRGATLLVRTQRRAPADEVQCSVHGATLLARACAVTEYCHRYVQLRIN